MSEGSKCLVSERSKFLGFEGSVGLKDQKLLRLKDLEKISTICNLPDPPD